MTLTADKLGSVLIAEVGTVVTRVTLIDTVDGESRFIAQAEAPTSTEAPHHDLLVGIIEATVQIARLTDRVLLDDGRLIFPQNSERNGINQIIVTSSAAGPMQVLITGIARDVSAQSALRATRCTYAVVLQQVTLDDAALQPKVRQSWVERQVQRMIGQQPDVLLLVGGIEGNPNDVVVRLANVAAFALGQINASRAAEQGTTEIQKVPVIYAGNTASRDAVQAALAGVAPLTLVENLRPTLEYERLDQTRVELMRLYNQHILPRLPGYSSISSRSPVPIISVVEASGLITRFVAEHNQRRVLTIDAGSASSAALFAAPGIYVPAVLSGMGTGYGLLQLLQQCSLEAIQQWLPFEMSERDLYNWLLNKALRPQLIPTTQEDLLIEHAVVRELIALLLNTLREELPNPDYDMLLGGGGVLAHAPAGLAALTLLDALQPTAERSTLALDLHVDQNGMLPATGALAHLSSDAAMTLFERNLLNNTSLATVVVVLGEGQAGKLALQADLTTSYGKQQTVRVAHGQIVRLPLAVGVRGQLRLRPASGVSIGGNEPGAEVVSEVGAIEGSELGVIIDARGRPLRLPTDAAQRRQLLWEWLAALRVVQGASPYTGQPLSNQATIETTTVEPPTSVTRGTKPVVAAVATAGAVTTAAASKQRGLFGRGKAEPEPAPTLSLDAPPSPLDAETPPIVAATPATPAPAPKKQRGLFGRGKAEPEPAPPPAVPAPEPPATVTSSGLASRKRGLFGGNTSEPEIAPPAVNLVVPPPATTPEPPDVQPRQRISLDALTAAEQQPPQAGGRISLDELRRQEQLGGAPQPDAERLQQDLQALRGALSQEEPKRGLFGRKKK